MEDNILKIDIDCFFKKTAINILKQRLSYMHDLHLLHSDAIKKIELYHKTKYSARIELQDVKLKPHFVIMFQLILSSDYMKECNTIINHYKYNMKYSNRMFLIKRYKNQILRKAKVENITQLICDYINNPKRIKKYN